MSGLLNATHPHESTLTLAVLDQSHLPQMMALQAIVRNALPEDQKRFLKPKSLDEFSALVQPPHSGIGAFTVDNLLVGQILMQVVQKTNPDTALFPCSTGQQLCRRYETFGVVQSVMVDPFWRGQGLMSKMLAKIDAFAIRSRLQALLSRVDIANADSSNGFDRHGYQKAGLDIDPFDNKPRLYFAKPVFQVFAPP